MAGDTIIKVDHVYKTFILPHEKNTSIKSAAINFYKKNRSFEKQQVIEDVSFEVKSGEFFGIVGRNGSGKSTLLKLLAGIYSPDQGGITVNGKLTPFIELGVGFNPELTGRENVYLNGALLGFNRKEMGKMYSDIVRFAELGRFMDQKLKNYSSGMQVRLAFSIAIRARGDVLLLDEVLAVGDAAFQQKCYDYFEELKKQKKTVVFVSHDMDAVKRFCTAALLLESGQIKIFGSPADIAGQYVLDNINVSEADQKELGTEKNRSLSSDVTSLEIKHKSPKNMKRDDVLKFEVKYRLSQNTEVFLGYSIVSNGFSVAEQNTKSLALPDKKNHDHVVACDIPLQEFNEGVYAVDVALFTRKSSGLIGYHKGAIKFFIEGFDELRGGPIRTKGEWRVL
jgi:ABC-2 type transport system ATP-binding protein